MSRSNGWHWKNHAKTPGGNSFLLSTSMGQCFCQYLIHGIRWWIWRLQNVRPFFGEWFQTSRQNERKTKQRKHPPCYLLGLLNPQKKWLISVLWYVSCRPDQVFLLNRCPLWAKNLATTNWYPTGKKKTGPEIVRHLVLRVPEREGKGESWPSFQELTFFSIIFWKVQKSPNKTRCHFCGVLEMFQVDRTPGFQKSSQKMILEYTVYIICYIFWGKWFRYTIFAPHPTLCFPNRFSTPRHRKQERCKRQRHRGLNQRHLGKNVWGWKPCSPKMEVDVVDVSENRGISPNHPMD